MSSALTSEVLKLLLPHKNLSNKNLKALKVHLERAESISRIGPGNTTSAFMGADGLRRLCPSS